MNDEERKAALRSFLLECRARIKPEDAGLPRIGRQRVEGLRREEVAQLAGVSASWYTLFETARDIRVSPRMLQNVAQALRLSRDETIYLFSLAIDEMPIVPRNGLEDATDPAAPTRPRTHNLPASLTSFHGRRRRQEQVRKLAAERRLVTLTGLGGIGKTRLAVEVARKLLDRFADGIWLVDFAAIADAALVATRGVAGVMGIQERAGRVDPGCTGCRSAASQCVADFRQLRAPADRNSAGRCPSSYRLPARSDPRDES